MLSPWHAARGATAKLAITLVPCPRQPCQTDITIASCPWRPCHICYQDHSLPMAALPYLLSRPLAAPGGPAIFAINTARYQWRPCQTCHFSARQIGICEYGGMCMDKSKYKFPRQNTPQTNRRLLMAHRHRSQQCTSSKSSKIRRNSGISWSIFINYCNVLYIYSTVGLLPTWKSIHGSGNMKGGRGGGAFPPGLEEGNAQHYKP